MNVNTRRTGSGPLRVNTTGPSVHSGSVVHDVPPAGMESVEDATPIDAIEHDVVAQSDVNLGEADANPDQAGANPGEVSE